LKIDPEFKQVVPPPPPPPLLYSHHLLPDRFFFPLSDKEKSLALCSKKGTKGNGFYELEMRKLGGHAWFEKGDYKKALPALEANAS
jgi:hypothetical protein